MSHDLYGMTSGECRWVGREDIHVYCWAPCDLVRMPTGREGWLRRDPVFKVVTAETSANVWDRSGWVSAAEAAREIDSLLCKEARNVA